jgi:hypothetical protein
MPPKKVTITPGQSNISAFFQKTNQPNVARTLVTTASSSVKHDATTDPKVSAFMLSLTPSELIAHKIAKEKLGTSYDVTRTHGFVRWAAST